MTLKPFKVADLFCGAGGSSTGVSQACEAAGRRIELVAVNHWDRAVETHAANHPDAGHHCEDLTTMDPRKAVPGDKLDLLVASPECTHHSVARGGMPCSDQSRASAWCVLRWVNSLMVDRVLIENVPEFVSWGPLGSNGKPLKSKRGETFEAFVNALKASGYRVDWRLLNAADYGAATSRRRLFLQAVRGRREIVWPDATHSPTGEAGLFGSRKRWRAAREIIDWTLAGSSIFGRKRPLSANTLARIEAGLRKFGGAAAEPFLVALNYMSSRDHDGRYTRSTGEPIPTITSQGNRFGLVEPFVIGTGHKGANGSYTYDPDRPLPTVTTATELGVVEPFIMRADNTSGEGGHERRCKSVDEPVGTIHAGGGSFGICEPFILPHRKFDRMDVDDIDRPIRTLDATNAGSTALVQPFLVPYYGANTEADSLSAPTRTITTKDRLGLVEPVQYDIRFRMLQPHELAAAMGFPRDYKITGNRGEQVKQIGNAVVVEQARALASEMLAL